MTKKTVLQVFKGIQPIKKAAITKNPEGFINEFFKGLRSVYADHIAECLTFHLEEDWGSSEAYNASVHLRQDFSLDDPLESFFPESKDYAGTELRDVDRRFMYEKVQVDSDVEATFVEEVLKLDTKVVLYFKFPLKFKLLMPAIIGNYNPDWGIIRQHDDGTQTLHLVRETKGQDDVRKLRFDHEKRKIACARKYFDTIEVDYRPISARTIDWYQPETANKSFS